MTFPRRYNKGSRLAAVGLELGVAVAIGTLGGVWLDSTLGTRPWIGLVGLLLGVAAGGKLLFRAARHAMHLQESQDTSLAPCAGGNGLPSQDNLCDSCRSKTDHAAYKPQKVAPAGDQKPSP